VLLTLAGTTRADDGEPPPQVPHRLRTTDNLDADRLFLGPVGGAIAIDGAWDGAVGAELAWLRIREHQALAAAGVAFGGARYAARDGGQLWLEGLVGTRRVTGLLIGVTAGPALELGALEHPRLGATASAWLFAGISPFVRIGAIDGAGAFVELGLALELPVWRF
jgi:hypothetical protein